MSYGFQAFDTAGRLLLSDAVGAYGYKGSYLGEVTPNYSTNISCSGTSSDVAWSAGSGNWRILVPKTVCPSPPLPMFEVPTHPNGCGWSGLVDAGLHWTVFFLSTVQPVVHVFGVFTDDQRSTVGMGMQVFDSNGLLTFDSLGRRPLQLLRPPIAYTQPAFSRTYQGSGPYYSAVTALNDLTIATGVTLPTVTLAAGVAIWDTTCEPDTTGANGKEIDGDIENVWWRLLGRSGNDIKSFGHRYLNCSSNGGWIYPFANPTAFNGLLMLADRSLYT